MKKDSMTQRFKGSINLAHLWAFDPAFMKAYEAVKDIVICSPDRCYVLWQLARSRSLIIEVGVGYGGTAKLMALAVPEAQLMLYDTFEGVPTNDEGIRQGSYACSMSDIQQLLPTAHLYKGRFEERERPRIIRNRLPVLIHIDCDLIAPIKKAIKCYWPQLTSGDIMMIDDYGINLPLITEFIDKYFGNKVLRFSYAQAVMIA